ncbi:MAG: hypothetical protein ACE5HC_12145 [Candidatus Binatia bacterium]
MLVALLSTLRIIHILAAAVWVGSVFFNYFLLRPALLRIPVPHAVVVAQRVGTIFLYTGWTALGLLFASGALRLYYADQIPLIFTLGFYAYGQGRSIAVMILAWFITVVDVAIISFVLRPRLIQKLSVSSNPRHADVEKRRAAQIAASEWLERLNLINVITSTLALIAGASIMYGGLF